VRCCLARLQLPASLALAFLQLKFWWQSIGEGGHTAAAVDTIPAPSWSDALLNFDLNKFDLLLEVRGACAWVTMMLL